MGVKNSTHLLPCALTSSTESQDVPDTQQHPSYCLSRGPGRLRTISMGPDDTQPRVTAVLDKLFLSLS